MEHEYPDLSSARVESCHCGDCPPDRVCAWACPQGMAPPDIVVAAMLAESETWALQLAPEFGLEAEQQALWNCFNA